RVHVVTVTERRRKSFLYGDGDVGGMEVDDLSVALLNFSRCRHSDQITYKNLENNKTLRCIQLYAPRASGRLCIRHGDTFFIKTQCFSSKILSNLAFCSQN